MEEVEVGLIGFGTVGSGVAKILTEKADLIRRRLGFPLILKTIADIDIKKDRGVRTEGIKMTTNADEVIDDPDIKIVMELIGGDEPARSLILKAISRKKHIVTANKALLAVHGNEILKAAEQNGVDVSFEGSVGGGIPIIRAMKEGLAANNFLKIFGIMNGTSNYILTEMTIKGEDFGKVLKKAQEMGYAEADPSFDVDGIDTAHKLAILISMAYSIPLQFDSIYVEGIRNITPQDIRYAAEFGYKIKLLAISVQHENAIEARVHPTMVPSDSIISQVDGVFNSIYVVGDATGPTMYYGQGAGMMPTGSAVVSDLMELARNIVNGTTRRVPPMGYCEAERMPVSIMPMKEIITQYYFRFTALDRPGVLSKISGVLGEHNISIASVIQKGRELKGGAVPVVMMTHEAKEEDVRKALEEIDKLDVVKDRTVFIRVEDRALRG